MDINKELVSVITPNYNGANFIVDTIKSVQAQTYTNWEMLIVDDNSSDNSVKVIEDYIKVDKRIRLFKNTTNLGAAVSRNIAIENAQGRFIAFLDGDDLWKTCKLEKQINFMLTHKYPFTYSCYDQITESSVFIKKVENLPNKISYDQMLSKNVVGCLTAIYDTETFGKVYMPLIRKRQDFGLWLKLLKQEKFGYCFNENLAKYRIRENSVSSNKIDLIKYHWYLYYDIEKFNILKSVYLIYKYIVRNLSNS